MVGLSGLLHWIDMHNCARKKFQMMSELMFDLLGDLMRLINGQLGGYSDTQFSVQSMANPTSPNVRERFHSGYVSGSVPNLLEYLGLNSVEHPRENSPDRLPDDAEDCDRDREAD